MTEIAAAIENPATREFPFAGHVFVWARPKNRDWSAYDGTNLVRAENDEFRPCKMTGHNASRRLVIIGTASHFDLDLFEIAEDVRR